MACLLNHRCQQGLLYARLHAGRLPADICTQLSHRWACHPMLRHAQKQRTGQWGLRLLLCARCPITHMFLPQLQWPQCSTYLGRADAGLALGLLQKQAPWSCMRLLCSQLTIVIRSMQWLRAWHFPAKLWANIVAVVIERSWASLSAWPCCVCSICREDVDQTR